MTKKTIQIVGPYFTNYSLAKVNRNLASAINKLDDKYEAFLYCDKDKIDWLPSASDLEKFPDIKDKVKFDPFETDIAIYNNFPKSVTNLHGLKNLNAKVKLMYTAWEDNSYPGIWVDEINSNLQGVMVASKFVKETLLNSGVKVPIYVVSNALDETLGSVLGKKYEIKTNKKFKFLHVSTAKQRKGVDVLLKAYFSEFTDKDDCTLVIKSFPGPDNIVDQLINELKSENSPEVIHINSADFTDEEIGDLNRACDCVVYPTRGEGFGLPILEAMKIGIPVITTGYSGHMDFCDYNNSYLLDFKLEISSKNEIVNLNSYWAEPDIDQLKGYMKEVFYTVTEGSNAQKLELDEKVSKAKVSADKISWTNSAKKTIEFIDKIESSAELKNQNIAVLTFLNDQTGIHFYSDGLYRNIEALFNKFYYLANSDIADRTAPDAANVIRNWSIGETQFNDVIEFLKREEIDYLHIQYHTGAFSPESLNELMLKLSYLGVKTFVTLHSVRSTSFDLIKSCANLKYATKIIFHNKEDADYAKQTFDNCELMRIPRIEYRNRNKFTLRKTLGLTENTPIIATHGLLNTNKGVEHIIETVGLLKKKYNKILFIALSAVSSNNILAGGLLNSIQEQINKLELQDNVMLVTDFLDRKVIEVILQSVDINILAYIDIAGESASAAVEKTLASLNPTIVTNIKAFEELNNEVFKIENNSPDTIAQAVEKLLNDKELVSSITTSAAINIEESSYVNKALETIRFYH